MEKRRITKANFKKLLKEKGFEILFNGSRIVKKDNYLEYYEKGVLLVRCLIKYTECREMIFSRIWRVSFGWVRSVKITGK